MPNFQCAYAFGVEADDWDDAFKKAWARVKNRPLKELKQIGTLEICVDMAGAPDGFDCGPYIEGGEDKKYSEYGKIDILQPSQNRQE